MKPMTKFLADTNYRPDPRPVWAIMTTHFGYTFAFNIGIAVIGTYGMHWGGGFLMNLVFSQCIGLLAWFITDSARLMLWGRGLPPRLPFIGLVLVTMPIAKFGGDGLAAMLLGLDPRVAVVRESHDMTSMVVLTLMFCAIISWFFWRRGEVMALKGTLAAEKARTAAIEKQALQAQLQMLQAQIEPHMLFNTLANLQGLIAVDPPRAQHMLDQLIQFLRATLSSSRAQKTTLGQEFALIDAYLGLMAVRMGARLAYSLQLPDALRAQPVPPMLLQPLVENAIKHGLEPKVDGGRIEVDATNEGSMLVLRVIDDGLGLDAARDSGGTQVGVANTRERLQALYGPQASFTLTANAPQGARAEIRIPL